MKLTRLILACTLLLSASFPLFALPECGDCENNQCVPSPYTGLPCTYDTSGNCVFYISNCTSLAPAPVLADWTVASVEVSCSAPDAEVVITPAEETEVLTAETAEGK